MHNFIYVAAGGNKKHYGERIPFLRYDGRTYIDCTLDTLVQLTTGPIIIASDDVPRMLQQVSLRNRDYGTQIHVVDGRRGIGTNLLNAMVKYTEIADNMSSFKGSIDSHLDYYRYIKENPECLDVHVMACGCDMPVASVEEIQKSIDGYEGLVRDEQAELAFSFTEKTRVNKVVNFITTLYPDFKERFECTQTTLHNTQLVYNKKARITGILHLAPFRAHRITYEIADDLYLMRYVTKPKNWLKIKNVISKYKDKTEVPIDILRFTLEMSRLLFSSDRLFYSGKRNKGNLLRLVNKTLNWATWGGPNTEKLCTFAQQVTNLKTCVNFEKGIGTMLDVDDEATLVLLRRYPMLKTCLRIAHRL